MDAYKSKHEKRIVDKALGYDTSLKILKYWNFINWEYMFTINLDRSNLSRYKSIFLKFESIDLNEISDNETFSVIGIKRICLDLTVSGSNMN